jgi:hypothetical protein
MTDETEPPSPHPATATDILAPVSDAEELRAGHRAAMHGR